MKCSKDHTSYEGNRHIIMREIFEFYMFALIDTNALIHEFDKEERAHEANAPERQKERKTE